jgi:hypothetical protein
LVGRGTIDVLVHVTGFERHAIADRNIDTREVAPPVDARLGSPICVAEIEKAFALSHGLPFGSGDRNHQAQLLAQT